MSCEVFARVDAFTVALLVATVWNAASIGTFSFLMMDIRRPASALTLLFSGSAGIALVALWGLLMIGICQ
ncbi:MAG: hypothetical protein ACK4Z3_00595 [Rhizobium rosettiformans]